MAKKYKGSLSLEWFNKQKAIINLEENGIKSENDIPAPRINWINKEEALFYEVNEEEGTGNTPYWVDRSDIRVKEARPLIFQKGFRAESSKNNIYLEEIEGEEEAKNIDNLVIKGDNLLVLNSLKKHFDKLKDEDKIKCIYIDPPYNTGKAFEHYDDNLETSTWLTLIRDRVKVLRGLLKSEGTIFIQLDEKFIFHLKIMLDEVFGKENFVNFFTVKTSDPSGFKTVNPSPYDAAEYILMYAKNKADYNYETIHVASDHDFSYNKYITNIEDNHTEWEVMGLNQYISEQQGYKNTREAKKDLGPIVFDTMVSEFAIENSESIFQGTAIGNDAGSDMIKLRNDSKANKGDVLKLVRENGEIQYAYNGRQVYFYSNKVKEIDGRRTPTKHLTNIWLDIPYNGISGEGNVSFSESKKPENLMKRIFQIANVKKGEYVLDSFSGSGTTIAVAHKLGFKYVGVELGDHCEELIIPRLKSIVENNDSTGISEEINWKGGGSFKYYRLGESIISIDKETKKGEFNWALGKEFIQESLLQSYDFVVQENIKRDSNNIFEIEGTIPTLGKLKGSTNKAVYGLAFLATPEENNLTITNEEVKTFYNSLKRKSDFQSMVIYTNQGVDIAQDAIPEDLDIIKVPHAIFSELER